MSRSRRKTPIIGIASVGRGSMRSYRKERAGQERAAQRALLGKAASDDAAAAALSDEQAPWNEWDCPRDGKQYVPHLVEMRRK